MKTGTANLPLHYGKAPAWLFGRMKKLVKEIVYILVTEYGEDEFLDRLSDPYWFQALGNVLGFDWHSSGLTTTVCGALKEGLKDISKEIGVYVCGGKGVTSRRTPFDIQNAIDKYSLNLSSPNLIYASKMSAKVDSSALQDGYQVYQHCFVFTKRGKWSVIQQGMNDESGWARRYHWLSDEVTDYVCEPHKAVCCDYKSTILNMIAKESGDCRDTSTFLANQKPIKIIKEVKKIKTLDLPKRHVVLMRDIKEDNLARILEKTYEIQPKGFEALLGIKGVGPKTIRSLSLLSELIYGKKASIEDPVRFSFAHGGKDGFPYPVNRKGYDLSIQILRESVNQAKIGRTEKLKALKRLADF